MNRPFLRSHPQVAFRIFLETADNRMIKASRGGFEVVDAVVREGHVGQFAPVCADPYPAVGIGEDRPHRVVGQRVGIMEVEAQQARAVGERVQQEQSRLRRHPDDACRVEKQLFGARGLFVFVREPVIPSDPAVAVAFVKPVHVREDVYRAVVFHYVADHAVVAAD